jgi:hypothetical protein
MVRRHCAKRQRSGGGEEAGGQGGEIPRGGGGPRALRPPSSAHTSTKSQMSKYLPPRTQCCARRRAGAKPRILTSATVRPICGSGSAVCDGADPPLPTAVIANHRKQPGLAWQQPGPLGQAWPGRPGRPGRAGLGWAGPGRAGDGGGGEGTGGLLQGCKWRRAHERWFGRFMRCASLRRLRQDGGGMKRGLARGEESGRMEMGVGERRGRGTGRGGAGRQQIESRPPQ